MVNHNQNRAALLDMVDSFPSSRRKGETTIGEQDYVGFPLPNNLSAAPQGDCLIWVGSLNKDGYGTGTFPSGQKLAHRESFRVSRGYAGENVLHLCHRPYCIQPSHLYDGSKLDNSDDRRLRLDDFPQWESFERASGKVHEAAKYRWSCPRVLQPPMISTNVNHDCEFIIPAGSERICSICSEPRSPTLRGNSKLPDMQPEDTDSNSYTVVRRSKQFTDLGTAGTLESNMTTQLNMAKNRAERRRIEREQRKIAKKWTSGEPRLIASHSNLIGPDGLSGELKVPPLPGPAVLLVTGTVRPVPEPLASHLAERRNKHIQQTSII